MKMRKSLFSIFLFWSMLGFLWQIAGAQQLPPEIVKYADMILYNGQVLTMDRDTPDFSVAEAVGVREGRIFFVGETDYALSLAGPDTVRIDLQGKALIPGVIDTHSHPNRYAMDHYEKEVLPAYMRALDESNVRLVTLRWDSEDQALADLAKVVERAAPGQLIFSPTRANPVVMEQLSRFDLDRVAPENPVFIKIGNAIWGVVNTKMLDILVEKYGDDLPGILRDEQGIPTGLIFGTAPTVIDQEVLPVLAPEVLEPVFKKELEEWVALGITTLSSRLKGNEITAYASLDRKGELPLRFPYTHELARWNPSFESYVKRLGNLQGHGTDRMWMIGLSVAIPDGNPAGPGGSAGGSICSTLPKLVTNLPDDYFPEGICHWDQPGDPTRETVLIANKMGYRIAGIHTFGDKGLEIMLDTFAEASQENSVLGRRFALDHGMMVSPAVIQKSARLEVIWSIQGPMFYGPRTAIIARQYGEDIGHRWVQPVKSLIESGVKVTYGADTHSDPERHPMFALELYVTRKTHDGRVWGPRERIDRRTGLLMLTRWGAEYVLRENELGSIEEGKLADLVILDQNPLDSAIPDEELSEIKVLMTIIGGEVAFRSPQASQSLEISP